MPPRSRDPSKDVDAIRERWFPKAKRIPKPARPRYLRCKRHERPEDRRTRQHLARRSPPQFRRYQVVPFLERLAQIPLCQIRPRRRVPKRFGQRFVDDRPPVLAASDLRTSQARPLLPASCRDPGECLEAPDEGSPESPLRILLRSRACGCAVPPAAVAFRSRRQATQPRVPATAKTRLCVPSPSTRNSHPRSPLRRSHSNGPKPAPKSPTMPGPFVSASHLGESVRCPQRRLPSPDCLSPSGCRSPPGPLAPSSDQPGCRPLSAVAQSAARKNAARGPGAAWDEAPSQRRAASRTSALRFRPDLRETSTFSGNGLPATRYRASFPRPRRNCLSRGRLSAAGMRLPETQ